MEKNQKFNEQESIMSQIYNIGFAEYIKTLSDFTDSFNLGKNKFPRENFINCLCCMDEGTPWGVHSAGSGILLSDDTFEKYFADAKLDAISSHDGCAALKVWAAQQGIPPEDADEKAKLWYEKIAKEKGISHIHISAEEMARPAEFHDARVCYYDGTGRFNYLSVKGLPEGFVVSRKYLGKDHSLEECGIALSVAFGHHGFGDLLTSSKKFLIIAIGQSEKDLDNLKAELSELKHEFGDKVAIDGFVTSIFVSA
ncbi:MAG: hypothetical protein WCW87_00120 [Candidatus Paceibacterota bacterium]